MRRYARASLLALAAVAAPTRPGAAQQPAPPPPLVAYTVRLGADGVAELTLEVENRRGVQISLRGGELQVNGEPRGAFSSGSPLPESWRSMLTGLADADPATALATLRAWKVAGLPPEDALLQKMITDAVAAVGQGQGTVLVPLPVTRAAVEVAEPEPTGPIEIGVGEQLAGVIGLLAAFAGMGIGLTMFGRRYLDTVSETIRNGPGRAFAAGLVGQIVYLPLFVLITIGLALTIIGLVALPFVALIYTLGAALAAVLGLLAVAHTLGEGYARRRIAQGAAGDVTSGFPSLARGLAMIGAFWLLAVLLGWIPLLGWVVRVLAALVTWFVVTTGAGAVLLSRFGVRDAFAGRVAPALTDEYLWATPVGTSPIRTVKRPGEGK